MNGGTFYHPRTLLSHTAVLETAGQQILTTEIKSPPMSAAMTCVLVQCGRAACLKLSFYEVDQLTHFRCQFLRVGYAVCGKPSGSRGRTGRLRLSTGVRIIQMCRGCDDSKRLAVFHCGWRLLVFISSVWGNVDFHQRLGYIWWSWNIICL